jgi:hypothetical protein
MDCMDKFDKLSDREILVAVAVKVDELAEDQKKKVSWRTFMLIFVIMSSLMGVLYATQSSLGKESNDVKAMIQEVDKRLIAHTAFDQTKRR